MEKTSGIVPWGRVVLCIVNHWVQDERVFMDGSGHAKLLRITHIQLRYFQTLRFLTAKSRLIWWPIRLPCCFRSWSVVITNCLPCLTLGCIRSINNNHVKLIHRFHKSTIWRRRSNHSHEKRDILQTRSWINISYFWHIHLLFLSVDLSPCITLCKMTFVKDRIIVIL